MEMSWLEDRRKLQASKFQAPEKDQIPSTKRKGVARVLLAAYSVPFLRSILLYYLLPFVIHFIQESLERPVVLD